MTDAQGPDAVPGEDDARFPDPARPERRPLDPETSPDAPDQAGSDQAGDIVQTPPD